MTTLEPSRFTACERHPDQHFTGFCAACLRERLAGLDQLQDTRRKSTSSANPLKAIFRAGDSWNKAAASSTSSGSFFPELRRCKSFSGPRAEAFSGVFEPQRKSCDVRGRSTLSNLFHQDDETRTGPKEVLGEIEAEPRKVGFVNIPEPELRVSEPLPPEEFHEIREAEEEEEIEEEGEIEEEEAEEEVEEETKTIKDHIDLDSMRKSEKADKEKRDLKEIAGSFWVAASVFSKKLQKWRRKQKIKKSRDKSTPGGEGEKPALSSSRRFRESRYRETQSEVADYGYGRRSCDTDPRFSLDAGRISFDDSRYSFDEPRASWDGYLIGARVPRLPPMLSVLEDAPAPVPRSDTQIPVEEARNSISEEAVTPGGTLQTREYYSDSSSSSRRRKNLERSGSVRKVGEIDETKSVSNSKVSPTTSTTTTAAAAAPADYVNGSKLSGPSIDRESNKDSNSNSNSLRDDCWESFDSVYRDATGVQTKSKKSRRWSMAWSIWGLIHRRNKDEEDERSCRASVIDRSFSESWPELRREVNGDPRGAFNRRVFRSNSSVSSRGSYNNGGVSGFGGSTRKSTGAEMGNGQSKKKREEFVLERNRSARYSPSQFDNGLLRFYLTPLRSSRRNVIGGVTGKSRSKSAHSFARSVLRLY